MVIQKKGAAQSELFVSDKRYSIGTRQQSGLCIYFFSLENSFKNSRFPHRLNFRKIIKAKLGSIIDKIISKESFHLHKYLKIDFENRLVDNQIINRRWFVCLVKNCHKLL